MRNVSNKIILILIVFQRLVAMSSEVGELISPIVQDVVHHAWLTYIFM